MSDFFLNVKAPNFIEGIFAKFVGKNLRDKSYLMSGVSMKNEQQRIRTR